jgi:iron complex transport system substrate-binding protein
MENSGNRIVSLLPATTEIVAALGFEDRLVGRSHECDMPASVQGLPACTRPKFNPDGQGYEIDQRLKALLQEGLSVYRVDAQQLAELKPDIIITQDHCEVCAASVEDVKKATKNYLQSPVEIVSVSPSNLREMYGSVNQIARALGAEDAGQSLVRSMKDDFKSLKSSTQSFSTIKVCCIEWLDPLMTAGNWVPELAKIATADTPGAESGEHSPWVEWEEVRNMNPDVICIMPCGYSIEQAFAGMEHLTNLEGWDTLEAVQGGRVYIADGHHYFNRPGPRLTDSARILAEMVHPELESTFKDTGWINYYKKHESVS